MGVVHKLVRTARTSSFESKVAAAAKSRRTPSPPAASSPATTATATATPTAATTATSASKYPRFGRRGAPQAFPSKLYEILEGENPDIIGWTATGRGFEVRDHARLSSEVLGRFFKQDKFSSFQRQLNLYGFRKITKGGESGSYQHPHFRRGERTTLLTIRRSTKASPARVVVPVSPASTGAGTPPPTVPLSNSNNGTVPTTKSSDGNATTATTNKNNGNKNKQLRSATPSPPPATVSRGVLPWPRPPVLRTSAAPAPPAPGALDATPPASGTITTTKQKQQWPAVGAAGTEGSRGNSWASHPDHANMTAKGQTGEGVDAAAAAAAAAAEKAALDHQDAEVVSLLQRMATEAQDSPARKQAALAAQQWNNGRHLQEGANPSTLQQHLQQPRFQMPRLGASGAATVGPNEAGQAQQTAFTEHLYDILSHERAGAVAAHQAAGFYPSAAAFSAAEERAMAAFPRQLQQHHHHPYHQHELPSPLGTASSSFSSSDGSSSSSSHLPQPPRRNDSFESSGSANRGGGSGEGGGGGEMIMSEHDRQVLIARSRSGPAAIAAEQEAHKLLVARSRPGPADFTRNEEHPYYQQQHHHNADLAFEHSPNRAPVGGRRAGGGFSSFDSARFGSRSSRSSGVLPPLPSLNFEQFAGVNGGSGGGTMEMEKVHRAPWRGAESPYVN